VCKSFANPQPRLSVMPPVGSARWYLLRRAPFLVAIASENGLRRVLRIIWTVDRQLTQQETRSFRRGYFTHPLATFAQRRGHGTPAVVRPNCPPLISQISPISKSAWKLSRCRHEQSPARLFLHRRHFCSLYPCHLRDPWFHLHSRLERSLDHSISGTAFA